MRTFSSLKKANNFDRQSIDSFLTSMSKYSSVPSVWYSFCRFFCVRDVEGIAMTIHDHALFMASCLTIQSMEQPQELKATPM